MTTFYSEVVQPIELNTETQPTLTHLFVSNGTQVVDLVSGTIGTPTGTVTHGSDASGSYFLLSSNPFGFITFMATDIAKIPDANGFTVVCNTTPLNVNNNLQTILSSDNNTAVRWMVNQKGYNRTKKSVYLYNTYYDSTYTPLSDGLFTTRFEASNQITFFNKQNKDTSITTKALSGSVSDRLVIGTYISNPSWIADGKYYYIAIYSNELSDSEILNIHADPFSLFKTQTTVNQEYGLKLNTAAQSISIPFIGATTGTVTYTDGTTAAITGLTGTYTLTGATPVFIAKITATDTNGFHYFEFNQTKLDTVTSHTSTLVCTLLGLPVDSGYVRGANGQIEGYQFTATTTATLTLTGAYTGLITYADNTTLAISDAVNGLGNYVVNSGIVKSITATDTIKSYNWDATIPDSTKIIDTVSGNHANLTIASVDKWQPVILKDVFTVNDYADIPTFATAQSLLANKKEYILNGNSLGGTISGFATGLKLIGTAKTDTITSALTLTTTGITELENLTTGNINATGATNVHLLNVEAADVTS